MSMVVPLAKATLSVILDVTPIIYIITVLKTQESKVLHARTRLPTVPFQKFEVASF